MLAEFLRSLLRLRKTTVSILLLLTYLTIGLIYVFDHKHYKHVLPEQCGFEEAPRLVEDAWLNLQNITYSYHPYFSRDNVRVHDYLLNKVKDIAQLSSCVNVSDDATEGTSVTLQNSFTRNGVIYFESANILAKIQGKDPELPGLLLSAHYDSVPTGHGATDDGKGVVSLLGLLDYYSQHQPERTLVFNFNNNEEFALLGAKAFFNHPWSKLVHYVINLEGTGIGGKAVLFRTSDVSAARIYQRAVKVAPFGNSIYQQGFYQRRVNSETDYKVYENKGLRGFDIAFYKPRDLYHTRKDSVQYTSREALWHMFHTAWQLTDYIAKNPLKDQNDHTPAIYFDVVGLYFFVTSAKSLFSWCCVILMTFPLIQFSLDFMNDRKHSKNNWMIALRLPLSFAISLLIVKFTQKAFMSHNPLVLSRTYMIPLLAIGTEFLVINYFILSFFEYLLPTQDFKTTAFRQVAMLTWVTLLFLTVKLYKTEYTYTGIYCLVILYPLCATASIVGYLSRLLRRKERETPTDDKTSLSYNHGSHIVNEEQQAFSTRETGDLSENVDENVQHQHGTPIDEAQIPLDERAPLLVSGRPGADRRVQATETIKGTVSTIMNYDWSLQFLIAVPISTFFIFNCVDLVLDALNQTVQERGSVTATARLWDIVVLGGIFLSLPVLPFVYKINYSTAILFILMCGCFLNLAFLESPFTQREPLKVMFVQQVNLTNSTDAVVSLYGRRSGFLEGMVQDLPSVKQNTRRVQCKDELNGLEKCSYIGYTPHPIDSSGPIDIKGVFSIDVLSNDRNSSDRSSYAPINAQLQINVKENRGCSLWFGSAPFDDKRPAMRQATIYRGDNTTHTIKSTSGFTELQLHKLDFDQPYFRVGLQWLPRILLSDVEGDNDGDDQLDVSVTCYWGEYDSESSVGEKPMRKLPAFDEILHYAPLNFSFSNKEKGLLTITDKLKL